MQQGIAEMYTGKTSLNLIGAGFSDETLPCLQTKLMTADLAGQETQSYAVLQPTERSCNHTLQHGSESIGRCG
jgi:hypothetical protein